MFDSARWKWPGSRVLAVAFVPLVVIVLLVLSIAIF
jgi:hypothetical protein